MTFTPAAIRVLLVEPHADSRELYVLGLTMAGFEVFAAEDGASATVAFAAHMPAVVVSGGHGIHAGDLAAVSLGILAATLGLVSTRKPPPPED